MCAHCSLRTDLPGFIDREHAEGNAYAIESGELFPCHMMHDPTAQDATNRTCLVAALVAGVPLVITPSGGQPQVYADLDSYVQTQDSGRRSNLWLEKYADKWQDAERKLWYGWWAKAPAGNWHYLMVRPEANLANSVYLFFDQAQEMFGPMNLGRSRPR
mgnify:CR=1 FL=1